MGVGRTGLAELLRPDGSPYPWSTPIVFPLAASCSAKVAAADGKVHHIALSDQNAGTNDGAALEIDAGTQDDGVNVLAVGYTGVEIAAGLNKLRPRACRSILTAPGGGLTVSVARDPESDPASATWDVMEVAATSLAFGRALRWLKDGKPCDIRNALAVRIMDDGSGPCPDISELVMDVADVEFVKQEG
jgi:hypothetical protein